RAYTSWVCSSFAAANQRSSMAQAMTRASWPRISRSISTVAAGLFDQFVKRLSFVDDVGGGENEIAGSHNLVTAMRHIAEIEDRRTRGQHHRRLSGRLHHCALHDNASLDSVMGMAGKFIPRLQFADGRYDFNAGRAG